MQNTSSSTPLWLDIKTEYIDENIDRVIPYLKEGYLNMISRDSFYNRTVELFEKRIDALLEGLISCPIYSGMEAMEKIELDSRLLGTFLLIKDEIDEKVMHAGAAFLSRLQILVPTYSQCLAELALDIFNGTIQLKKNEYPFSWIDVLQFNPNILAHKICFAPRKLSKPHKEKWIEKKGTMKIHDGHVDISSEARKSISYKDQVYSMEVFDGRLRFLTAKGDKLKKSDEEDIEKMERFTRDFLISQKDVTPVAKRLKGWTEGDRLTVRVTGKRNSCLYLKSTSKDHEPIEGVLENEEGFLYYDTIDFFRALNVGDRIEVTLSSLENKTFTVSKPFIDFIIQERVETGENFYAYIHSIRKDRSGREKAYMWADDGFPVMGYARDSFSEGDFVEVRFNSFGEDRYYGVVNVDIICKSDPYDMTADDTKRDCILSYRYEEEAEVQEEKVQTVNEGQLKEICRMLVTCQKSFPTTADRYRILCATEIICNMMSWNEDARFIEFVGDYLEDVVKFVRGNKDKMRPLVPADEFRSQESVQRRIKIIEILMAYEDPEKNDVLLEALDQDDEQLKKLAALIQSNNSIGNFLSRSMKNVIRREIINTLSLEDDGDTDLDKENGIYLGLENERQEFKTSFFFAPKDAKEQDQKMTIFKGVCAFLNSRNGGTLFIGVDDLGYVKGLDAELEHLEKVGWGNYHGIDGYVRYITDQAKQFFDLSILTHVNISAMYDGQVCAINITPYEYNIVELEDTAYIRLNNESVVMNDATRRKIMADRIILNQDDAMIKSHLIDAITNRRQVVLHGYSSSNGGDIRDRHVEPFMFASGHEAIWCFDCDDRTNKVFRTDRISNVEVLSENWMYASRHKSLKMDIFRMTGDKPMHVRLQLNMMARNVLLEEYEEARNTIIPTDDADVWFLDTDVYKIEGIGRFYMGLANAIKIIDAPELEAYVQEYARKYLIK